MKNFTKDEIKTIGITQAGAACFSMMSSILVIIFIVALKKYKKITQRLVMYLNISIFFNSTSFIIRGIGYDVIENKPLCTAAGYYGQLTAGFILASIWCIIIEIVYNACKQKHGGKLLECVYLVLIFIVPPVTGTIPFIENGYGNSRAWCWIRGKDEDGEKFIFGLVLQYVLWYIPLYILIIVGGAVYFIGIIAISVKIKRHDSRYSSDGSVEGQKLLLKELHQFRWYPVIYFFINLVPLANRVYDIFNDKPLVELWIASGAVEGLQGVIVAVLFCMESSMRRWILLKLCCCSSNCCIEKSKDEQTTITNHDESTPLSQSPHNSYETVPSPYSAVSS